MSRANEGGGRWDALVGLGCWTAAGQVVLLHLDARYRWTDDTDGEAMVMLAWKA